MDRTAILTQLEALHGRITWHTEASFYADTQGNLLEEGVLLYLTDVTFRIWSPALEGSFDAIDVLYTDEVRKAEVLELVSKKRAKVSRVNPISAMFTETVTALDFGGNRMRFFKFKVSEFRQLLRVAQAKQKYSLTVADRNK